MVSSNGLLEYKNYEYGHKFQKHVNIVYKYSTKQSATAYMEDLFRLSIQKRIERPAKINND